MRAGMWLVIGGCSGGAVELTPSNTTSEPEVVDYTLDPAEYPAPAGGQQWLGPKVTVEPLSEVQFCAFATYTGPDIGLNSFDSWQGEGGHHLIILGTNADEGLYADGEVIDCTETGDIPMTSFEPIINAEPISEGRSSIELPQGMAVKLRSGQRYVVQAHYVNPSREVRTYQDVMTVGFIPEDEVDTWAAAFALTDIAISVPAGEQVSTSFDCALGEAYEILYLTGHMHELGESYRLDYTSGGETEELFSLDPWLPEYRDAPPLRKYEAGTFTLDPEGVLTTTCNWSNDEAEGRDFPGEMCATYGMLYPSLVPVICVP